jgi:hypothetical protein
VEHAPDQRWSTDLSVISTGREGWASHFVSLIKLPNTGLEFDQFCQGRDRGDCSRASLDNSLSHFGTSKPRLCEEMRKRIGLHQAKLNPTARSFGLQKKFNV